MAKAQTITILNWAKYNPRSDVKNSSWYRKDHAIHFDPDWWHFDAEEFHVWDHLLALASLKNKPSYRLEIESVAKGARVSEEKVESALNKLLELECISLSKTLAKSSISFSEKQVSKAKARNTLKAAIRAGKLKKPDKCELCSKKEPLSAYQPNLENPLEVSWLCRACRGNGHASLYDTDTSRTRNGSDTDTEQVRVTTNGRTDGRTSGVSENTRCSAKFNFEEIYKKFPRRGSGKDMRKADGMKKCRAQIKSEKKYQDLARAVENYAQYVADEKRKDSTWCYNVQWGTFMSANYWVDWVNPEDSQKKHKPILIGSDECSQKNDSIL